MLLLCSLFLFILSLVSEVVTSQSAESKGIANTVPKVSCNLPWLMVEEDDDNACVCAIYVKYILWCRQDSVSLPYCYCMSFNEEHNTTVVGYCAVRCYVSPYDPSRKVFPGDQRYNVDNIVKNYDNMSEFNSKMCSGMEMNRAGQLCGSCVEGYAPPVYSYSLGCVECSEHKYNWLKYIAIAYLPLTLFFVVIITFKISATSGIMNGFILTSQIFAAPTVLSPNRHFVEDSKSNYISAFYGIWNLDFFRAFYTPFCIHPSMTAVQTRALDYTIAVYPLLLVCITYFFASLHYRYSTVVRLWRPFYRVFRCIRKEWDIRNSLIGAFATFILLSYVKILNISLDLLTPAILYEKRGNTLPQLYLNIDGTIKYFGKEHIPYAVLALVMATFFIFLPLVLLCLYPCRCFHRVLNYFNIQREVLREFMEIFQGEFKYQPRDFRYFAAFYLFIRIANLLVLFCSNNVMYFSYGGVLFAASAVFVAMVKPYKSSIHTNIDTLLLIVTAIAFFSISTFILSSGIGGSSYANKYSFLLFSMSFIHPIYGAGLLVYILAPKQKLKQVCAFIRVKLTRVIGQLKRDSTLEEAHPYLLEHNNEYAPLINSVELRFEN